MHETGHSKPVHWYSPDGWDRERGGRQLQDVGTHVQPQLFHVNVWQKPPRYCKVISLQLKQINFLKKFSHAKKGQLCVVMNISQTYGDHLAIYRYSSPPLFTVSLPIDSVTCGQLQSKNTTVCPLGSMGSYFEDLLQIHKSLDAQVPQSTLWILGSASVAPVDSISHRSCSTAFISKILYQSTVQKHVFKGQL